jgi:peptidoglycan/xylan/chitin deacetylase (PgdA/CDA1 family)
MPVFPGGCKAAISLTYDDGAPQLLGNAIPDLESAGLRGTFFNQTGPTCPTWASRRAEWKSASDRGHELGNHTVRHPCSNRHNWMPAERALETYSLESMEQELLAASDDIAACTGVPTRSFAYTCGEDFVGPDRISYRAIVARRFLVARAVADRTTIAIPGSIDPHFVPSFGVPPETNAQTLIDYVDLAIARGGWGVFCFHGIGGGHRLNVSRDAHQRLCDHIRSRADVLWCDTFGNVGERLVAIA